MADLNQLIAVVEAAVAGMPDTTFYDGAVPDTVPTAGGYILPYVVLWAGTGDHPGEAVACGDLPADVLAWAFQTSVVAASPAACRAAAADLRQRLTNQRAGTGRVRPNPSLAVNAPIRDTTITPHRYYLPIEWAVTTN